LLTLSQLPAPLRGLLGHTIICKNSSIKIFPVGLLSGRFQPGERLKICDLAVEWAPARCRYAALQRLVVEGALRRSAALVAGAGDDPGALSNNMVRGNRRPGCGAIAARISMELATLQGCIERMHVLRMARRAGISGR
jgi:hypothetical protein